MAKTLPEDMKELVLIGAGHTHVQLLKMAAMKPLKANITLVVDHPVAIYSGMIPGLVAGRYRPHELSIDARPLAKRAGIRILHAAATRIDTEAQRVQLVGRPSIPYDLLSINIGSTVAGLSTPGVREYAVPTRPIKNLIQTLDARIEALGPSPNVAVVGAGAGGVELAFCIEHRLRTSGRTPNVSLVFRSDRVLPGHHGSVQTRVERAASRRGIHLHPRTTVKTLTAQSLHTTGNPIPTDLSLWVTGASAHALARDSDLPVDDRGFIWVNDDLTVEGHPNLFAAGDCAVLRSWPSIPKAGVYAVRQGPVLAANLRARVRGDSLQNYRAQRDFFGILNLGDGTAIGTKWGMSIEGRWVMEHKDRIDRTFMERFQVLRPDGALSPLFNKPMSGMDGEMVCGGCAAKVAQRPLARALARLEPTTAPEIVIGPAEADDVVVWRDQSRLTVQNIDTFSAFTDDPYIVGRVAAHNATSDVWAKGVRPRFAMATVQIPTNSDHEEVLFQVMSGLRASLDTDSIALLGGHTTLGDQLVVGLVVTGFTDAIPWRNSGARPGDALILTRPLGTGVLFHADMAGRASGPAMNHVLRTMLIGNRRASKLAREQTIHASTDITGFGLAGHLAEMLRSSGCGAHLKISALPLFDGVSELFMHGERSSFHEQNRELLVSIAALGTTSNHPAFEALFDPQTAGGLLFATPEPEALITHLHAHGETAWQIGTCTTPLPNDALFEVHE